MTLRIPRFSWLLVVLPAACGDAATQGNGNPLNAPSGTPSASDGADAGTGTPLTGSTGSPAPASTPDASTGAPAPTATAEPIASAPDADAGTSDAAASAPPSSMSSPDAGVPVVVPPPRTTPDAFVGAPAYTMTVGNSAHNPGQSCMKSGCHGPGGGETPFLVGGTVYKDYKGTIPAPGVEIRVLDAKGSAVSVYSGSNGNFYIGTSSSITVPYTVGARDGTITRPMVTNITGTMGTCASNGCHVVGGSPMTTAYYPIHVP